jgi:predicted metal-binding protein
MKKVMIVGCGAYMDSGYGCPGEWRCLKSAAIGEGNFGEPVQVMSFIKCQCPGRSLVSNVGLAIKMADMKPEAIYLSSCMANAKPACPYSNPEEISQLIQGKTGVPVMLGTHDYH